MTRGTCDGPHPLPGPAHPWPEDRPCYCKRCETAGMRWAWSLPETTRETGTSGRCRLGHPVTALGDTVAGRLYTAGITPADPGLALLRAWNAATLVRSAVPAVTGGIKADTPGRRANGESPGPVREHGPVLFPASAKELPPENEKLPETGSWSQLNPTGTRSRCFGRRSYRALQHNQESR
jgi:hypothetical protein